MDFSYRVAILASIFISYVISQDLNTKCVVDMIVLLDSSASVESEFDREKDILISLISDTNIFRHDIRIGLMQFNQVVTRLTSFEVLTEAHKSFLVASIKDLQNSAGSTNTLEALQAAYWEFHTLGRPEANRILIIITDGIAQNTIENLAEAVRQLRSENVEVFATTASHKPDLIELLLYTNNKSRLFQADESAALIPAISNAIRKGNCAAFDIPVTYPVINTTVASTTEGFETFPVFLRVLKRGSKVLQWAPVYVEPANTPNIFDVFKIGINDVVGNSSLGDGFIGTEIVQIHNPKLYNDSWDLGLIFQFTLRFRPKFVKDVELWESLLSIIRANSNRIGSTDLYISYGQPSQVPPTAIP